jgi:pimeloyl-ACP methyl ester carboxylesterase
MWDPQLGSLRAAGFRVIAPDLRGFGASEAGPPGPLTMEQHADDLAGLLDTVGISEPVIVCGLSMGGYVSFALWRRHRPRVKALVLMDTRATNDTDETRINREQLAQRAEAQNSPMPALEVMLPRYFAPSLRPGSLAEHLSRSMILSTSVRAVADGVRGLALRDDSVELLGTIDVLAHGW